MNGFAEHRASETSGQSKPRRVVLTWEAGMAMLPLVQRIVKDILGCQQRLSRLEPERARLERTRADSPWPQRARRYEIGDEIAAASRELRSACVELSGLGVVLLHPKVGLAGFPTIVNNKAAYFAWLPGEDKLSFWCFAADHVRRPVPEDWTRAPQPPVVKAKTRRRKG